MVPDEVRAWNVATKIMVPKLARRWGVAEVAVKAVDLKPVLDIGVAEKKDLVPGEVRAWNAATVVSMVPKPARR